MFSDWMIGEKKKAYVVTMSLSINCLTISGHSNSRPQTLSWEWAQCPVGAAPEPSSIIHAPPPSLRWLHSWSLTFFIWFSLSYFDSRLFGLGILRAWEGLLIIFFWIMPHMLKVTEQWCLKKKSHLPEEGKNDIWFLRFRPGIDENTRQGGLQKPWLTIYY